MTINLIAAGSNSFSDLQPTPVYDSYWRFASERQAIFFRRLRDETPPWSLDPILQRHKFTNVYRASDRASQFLIRNIIYNTSYSNDPTEVVFRVLLFKLFNRIETWRLLESRVGPLTWKNFRYWLYDDVLSSASDQGMSIYSAAYIIPPVRLPDTHGRKHRGHLLLIEMMMGDGLPYRLGETKSLRATFENLRQYPSLGDFLAFQMAIDLNYSTILNHNESEFVMAGPGACDGIAKCFANTRSLAPDDIIRLVADRQEYEFARLGLEFQSLFGRPMQLIDCQNLFCEISKYARVAHPDVPGISGRTRIKQKFRATSEPLEVWYPPKWGLNDRLPVRSRQIDDLFYIKGAT
jgi:alpha-glutamyl/putrescinyl thymine pyrophosphorylase clade 1